MNRKSFSPLRLVAILGLLLPVGAVPSRAQSRLAISAPTTSDHGHVTAALQSAPMMFIENIGQFADGARFLVPGSDRTLWLAEDALWVTVLEELDTETQRLGYRANSPAPLAAPIPASYQGANVKLSFIGANSHPRIEPLDRLDTVVSYFLGNDQAQWRPNVPVWGGVRYVDLYPGIDLEITGQDGRFSQRLVAHPGGNLSAVRLQVDGAETMTLEGNALRLTTAAGEFIFPLFQVVGGTDGSLAHPTIADNQVIMPFTSAILNPLSTIAKLQSDNPDLLYSTFLGGSSGDDGLSIAVDDSGNAYVAGSTRSTDFPTTPGAFDSDYSISDKHDTFVVKLNADGSDLLYATYLGGSEDECNFGGFPFVDCAIAIDGSGNAYVAGATHSSDFPTTSGAFDGTLGGSEDAFVTKLNPTGSALVYSTYLGGTYRDKGHAIAVDASGNVYVAGLTESTDFPATPGAFDTTRGDSGFDAFVAKLNATGSDLMYATYVGGNDLDGARGIAIDGDGNAYVAGYTFADDFPTTSGAYDETCGWLDAYVVKLNPAGSDLLYATCLGGEDDDWSDAIAVDEGGAAYVTGRTFSSDFPATPGAYDKTFNGSQDFFVAKFSPAGDDLLYATYLGGSSWEEMCTLTVDNDGMAYVVGVTTSSDFPTTPGASDSILNGYSDAFVTKLTADGSTLVYSTFLGGSEGMSIDEYANAITLDKNGHAYVTGATRSSDFPVTPDAFDTTIGWSGGDAFVAKLTLPSANVDAYVQTPALVSAPPAGIAVISIQYGNHGATTATSVTLTATLDSSLTYVRDTSGISPTVNNNTVTWDLPDLAFRDSGQFDLHVNLSGSAPIGARYPVMLTISSGGTEDKPNDNTASLDVMTIRQIFLPLILRNP